MVGGIVIEVAEVKDRPGVLFIDCRDRTYAKGTCAIYVEKNETSDKIEVGDSIWWQGRDAMWTPAANAGKTCDHREHDNCRGKCGVDYDIKIPRVGYSGVKHPARVAAAMVVLAILLFPSIANAQWRTKTYHAQQYRTTAGTTSAEATVNIQNISPSDPGWKTELLRVLNAEKKRAAEATRQAEENAAYLQALSALGYPTAYQSASNVAQSSAYGGNSIYGYTYSTMADYFSPADRAVTLNQYQNAANRTIDLANKATDNMRDLIQLDVAGQERVATIVAEGQKATAIINAASQLAKDTQTAHTRIQTTQQVIGNPPPAPQQAQASQPNVAAVTATCAKCHSGETPKQGLTLDGSVPLSFDQYDAARSAIDNGTMPPPDSGVILSQEDQDTVVLGLRKLLIP